MQTRSLLTSILILIVLIAVMVGSYALGRFISTPRVAPAIQLPPLSRFEMPPQTHNGITASVESYYADAARFIFKVKATSEKGDIFLDRFSLQDEDGREINSSGSFNSRGTNPFHSTIEFGPAVLIRTERFKGRLTFAAVTSIGDGEFVAQFSFDLDLPVHRALIFNPKQTVWANGLEILLDRVVITPAYTQAYLCYIKPTNVDWMISSDTTLRIDSQVANVATYNLLFDGSKGGEPGWTPPVQNGRCVKAGFPVGSARPEALTLTIPALEQSLPEVIPTENLAAAYKILKAQGIEMEWHMIDHGAYPEYKKLPFGMSEQEAYRQFIHALGYTHPGAWIFEWQFNRDQSVLPSFSTSSFGAATPMPFSSGVTPTATLQERIRAFDVSPHGKSIAFATSEGIAILDLNSKDVRELNNTENFYSIEWSPDGRKLAAGSIRMNAVESGFPHVTVWDSTTWKILYESEGEQESSIPFGTVAWSPNGKLLAASLHDRGLAIIDVEAGKITSQLSDFLLPSEDIAWSPDGSRLLATGDLRFGFRRWHVDSDESVRLYDPRAGTAALQLIWSRDGESIVSSHAGGMVCIWTAETNQCDGFIQAHKTSTFSLAFSPDESQLATGGGVIHIWDLLNGQLIKSFGLHETSIYSQLEWLPDGRLVSLETGYAATSPTVVRFWDVKTGSVLMEFQGASGSFGE